MRSPLATVLAMRGRACLLILALMPSLLPGCTGPYKEWEDRSDACYAERASLVGIGNDFQKTVLGATAIGAGIGGATGFAINRSWTDAAIGAVAGALTGSLVGYLGAKYKQGQSQRQVLSLIDQDASHDSIQVNRSANAITEVIACRDQQISKIETDYAAQTLTREQALTAYRSVQVRTREDDRLIATLLGAADQRAAKYISARADTLHLPPDAEQVASPATEQLSTARQNAAAEEAAYKHISDEIDRHISELEKAVG